MRIREITFSEEAEMCSLRAKLIRDQPGAQAFDLWYRFPTRLKGHLDMTGTPFLAAALLPSMAWGEDLRIDGPISTKLAANLDRIMEILQSWDGHLQKIAVQAELYTPCQSPEQIGSFFTLGVDSFYTLLKNLELHPVDAGKPRLNEIPGVRAGVRVDGDAVHVE